MSGALLHIMESSARSAWRAAAVGAALLVTSSLIACSPNSQSTTHRTGQVSGTTLHLSIVDDFSAMLGGAVLGGAEAGYDRLDGDLVQVKPGRWQGTATGTTDRSIEIIVLDDKCKTHITGTQKLNAVATSGSYPDKRNLRVTVTPLHAPTYQQTPQCDRPPVVEKAPNGIPWLDFYFDAYRGGPVDVRLPRPPGGTWTWELAPNPNPGYPANCGIPQVAECSRTTTVTVDYR